MDRTTVQRYVELLTGDPETPLHWRAIHDKDDTEPAVKLFGSFSEHADELEQLNANNYGIFTVINDGGDSDRDITQIRAVFIDGDKIEPPAEWHLKPDFMVRRDTTHWHAYWLVDDLPVKEFRTLQRRLIKQYGSDKAVVNESRVLRIPGTYHHKGEPILVKLLDKKRERWELGHHKADVEAGLPPAMADQVTDYVPPNANEDSAEGLRLGRAYLIDRVRQGDVPVQGQGGDGLTLYHAMKLYSDYYLSKEKTLDLMVELYNPYCNPAWDVDDLGVKIENASLYHKKPRGTGLSGTSAEAFGPALDTLLAQAPPPSPERASAKPEFYAYSQDEQDNFPDPVWLIPELLPEEGICVFYGEPGSYKSFLTMDIALSLAYGIETFGYKPDAPMTTVYVAAESAKVLGKIRRRAWRIGHEQDGPAPFYLVTDMPLAEDPANYLRLAQQLDAQGIKPKLIVIDTMSQALEGMNENDSAAISKFMGACRQLRRIYGATILIIHHTGKDASRGARGHSSINGTVDMAALVEANDETKAVQVRITKMRDTEKRRPPWTFQGKTLAGALVFYPTSAEEHSKLMKNDPVVDQKIVGSALMRLEAIGKEHAVTTHVLATDIVTSQAQRADEQEERVKIVERALKALSRTTLMGYCEKDGSDLVWFMPGEAT